MLVRNGVKQFFLVGFEEINTAVRYTYIQGRLVRQLEFGTSGIWRYFNSIECEKGHVV